MKPKTSLLIYRICIILGVAVVLVVAFMDVPIKKGLGFFIGAGLAVVGAVQANIFYKCPNCNQPISPKGAKKDVCPNCGEKLNF